MPRPKPPPEIEPKPSSVSFPRYLKASGERLVKSQPSLALRDFSDLVNRALAEYIERHYPGLLSTVRAELQRKFSTYAEMDADRMTQLVAEDAEVKALLAKPPSKKTARSDLHQK